MFPNTVTIFNVINSKESIKYHRQVVSDVFYHKNKIISQEGKGEKYTYAYNVIFSNIALLKWKDKRNFDGSSDTYTLRENDIIVLDEYGEISESNMDWFLIKTTSENIYGDEELRNIEVTN